MESRTYHFILKTVAPVHIGCGEVYEPTNFAIDEQREKLIPFDTTSFLARLDRNELDRFSLLCRKGTADSLLDIFKFIRLHSKKVTGRPIEVTADFVRHYRDVVENKQQLNRFEIGRTAFHALNRQPYIPGSAVKGAIRTAILNLRNKGRRTPGFRGKDGNTKLQEHLLKYNSRKMETDPFRLIKVSDFQPIKVSQKIVYGINKKKKSAKNTKGIPQIMEIISPHSEFAGTITVQTPISIQPQQPPVTFEELHRALVSFYHNEKQKELRTLDLIGCRYKGFQNITPDTVLLRIGRHSGAECVTVEGHRQIKINNSTKSETTTIWLAAGSKKPGALHYSAPFGWATLSLLSDDEIKTIKNQRTELFSQWEKEQKETLVELRRKKEEIKLQREAERREQERLAEERRKRAEEERKYPWRKLLTHLPSVSDWGALKLLALENQELQEFQHEKEVGGSVKKAAESVAANHPGKWDTERDELMRTWLEPSGITWQNMAKQKQADQTNETLQLIRHFSGPKDYDRSLDISCLDKECCGLLADRFKKWKWNNKKKARKTNHQLWLRLQKRRRELKE